MPRRLGVGALYSNLPALKNRLPAVSWHLPADCVPLQSENSLEQDPCQIISILDAKCRSAREYA